MQTWPVWLGQLTQGNDHTNCRVETAVCTNAGVIRLQSQSPDVPKGRLTELETGTEVIPAQYNL